MSNIDVEDKPRIISSEVTPEGTKIWYVEIDGKKYVHRDTGPAIEMANGHKEWYNMDVLDRDYRLGPAQILADGTQKYYEKGIQHRPNGAAVLYPDGGYEYWVKGKQQTVWTKDKKEFRSENKVVGLFAKLGNYALRETQKYLK